MVNSKGVTLREFHALDENVNHVLQPMCALLGRVLHEQVQLLCVGECEVVQFLFRVGDGESVDL